MQDDATAAVPQETGALNHLLTTDHAMHWAGLAALVPLAERVEDVHADAPEASS